MEIEAFHKHDGAPGINDVAEDTAAIKTGAPVGACPAQAGTSRLGREAQRFQKICHHRREMLTCVQLQFGFAPCYVNRRLTRFCDFLTFTLQRKGSELIKKNCAGSPFVIRQIILPGDAWSRLLFTLILAKYREIVPFAGSIRESSCMILTVPKQTI